MKTIEEIMDYSRPIADVVRDLRVRNTRVPSWGELSKQYDASKHPIMSDPEFMPRKGVKMCRVRLGWQKLATRRMAELCFGIPVKHDYRVTDEQGQRAARILEAIYSKNRMDAENINRARMIYAGCEFATIWYTQEQETMYGGERSATKIRCRTYSPMQGDIIYPLFDDFDDLVALSVEYHKNLGTEQVTYFESYTATEHNRWVQRAGTWEEDMPPEQMTIGKIAGVYAWRDEPIWEDESENVSEAEYALSRNGNYIRKNSKPNWVVYADQEDLVKFGQEKDTDSTARNVLHYPANAKAGFETWSQATDALEYHIKQIRENFHSQLQLTDMSFDSMKTTPMSGEARKMMFIDAQLKVTDEKGLWTEVLSREMSVIKAFARLMFPSLAEAFDTLECDFVITPFSIQDMGEKVNVYTAATQKPIMSQRTAIQKLGEVDDVNEEMKRLAEEDAATLEESVY